ncbi:MAG: transposase [Bacteroidales bacterium]|jgi:transposase-like protein|nr:transposase [Bacteroidales bacterium]
MNTTQKKTVRYSESFKLEIIRYIEEEGYSINDIKKRYDIKGGQTVQSWIKKYGKNQLLNKIIKVQTMKEIDELKRLREENKALKLAYAELSLEHKCSEKVIELADEMFGMDLKKKYESERLMNLQGRKR